MYEGESLIRKILRLWRSNNWFESGQMSRSLLGKVGRVGKFQEVQKLQQRPWVSLGKCE